MGDADLGGHGVDRPVLPEVPVLEVAGHVGEAQPVQCGSPVGVGPGRSLPRHGGRGRGGDGREVAGQPVLVQPGLTADRRQAGPARQPGQDERPEVRISVPPGHLVRDPGDVTAGPLGVGLRYRLGRDARQGLPGLPEALLRITAPGGRGRRIPGECPGAGPLPPGGAAGTEREVEHQAGGEGGRAELAGVRALQRLAALQAEGRAVGLFGVAVHAQVGGDRPERPPAQVADHPPVDDDHLADRGEGRGAVRQHGEDRRRASGQAGAPRVPRCSSRRT